MTRKVSKNFNADSEGDGKKKQNVKKPQRKSALSGADGFVPDVAAEVIEVGLDVAISSSLSKPESKGLFEGGESGGGGAGADFDEAPNVSTSSSAVFVATGEEVGAATAEAAEGGASLVESVSETVSSLVSGAFDAASSAAGAAGDAAGAIGEAAGSVAESAGEVAGAVAEAAGDILGGLSP